MGARIDLSSMGGLTRINCSALLVQQSSPPVESAAHAAAEPGRIVGAAVLDALLMRYRRTMDLP